MWFAFAIPEMLAVAARTCRLAWRFVAVLFPRNIVHSEHELLML
jgi:hypothetical protein